MAATVIMSPGDDQTGRSRRRHLGLERVGHIRACHWRARWTALGRGQVTYQLLGIFAKCGSPKRAAVTLKLAMKDQAGVHINDPGATYALKTLQASFLARTWLP